MAMVSLSLVWHWCSTEWCGTESGVPLSLADGLVAVCRAWCTCVEHGWASSKVMCAN